MRSVNRTRLFNKLNTLGYQTIEAATRSCKLRGNRYVDLAHWLDQILDQPDSDLLRVVQHFSLDASRLAADITLYLDGLARGASSISDFDDGILEALEKSWVIASIIDDNKAIRSGHLLLALLQQRHLRRQLLEISSQFQQIKEQELADDFHQILESSAESRLAQATSDGAQEPAPAEMGKRQALAKYAVDMTKQARDSGSDPIVGRDSEIRQLIDILMRRRQNNPILTGEAGVGKTAVVEGFAQKIVAGDVPPALQNVELHLLDVGLLQAGASMKGEFEQRLRQVIEEVQSSETPIILFIDEAHTLIGAGGAAGTGDAANLLKPALARGTLRTIAATTWAEYKKHIEKDPALTRRFQVVQVGEPEEDKAVQMMRALSGPMGEHHQVMILDEALEAAVNLSHRYIPARQLPDKAVSLLDTACARVAVSLHAVPAELDDCRQRIAALEVSKGIVERELALGFADNTEIAEVENQLAECQQREAELNTRWEQEKDLVAQMVQCRAQLISEEGDEPSDAEGARDQLVALRQQLAELQGERPLIHPLVDAQSVASVVQDWTGIPLGRMMANEMQTVLQLPDLLEQRIIGQRHALETIAKRIQTTRAQLDNPSKPVGVFMLAGSSGVGKTETALALAERLYGGEQNLITINMSEFQEAHTVSTLKGAPPGYVGYGEGGVLTEAVRRRPYSVVLLDEIEKAHSDVHELFFQVFDKGWMEDGEGRAIDFRNTVILLTTNVGTDLIVNLCQDPELTPSAEEMGTALRDPLLKVFPPALLGRLVVIPYYPLSAEVLSIIAKMQIGRITKRMQDNHGVALNVDSAVVDAVISRCNDVDSGGRLIDQILTHTLLPQLSRDVLERRLENTLEGATLTVSVEAEKFITAWEG